MRTLDKDGTTHIEYERQTHLTLLQFLRSNPEALENLDNYKRLSINTEFSNGYAAYRKISDGFWYMRFEHSFHSPTEIKIGKTASSHFYELEYFFIDKHQVIQKSMDEEFSLHSTAVFSSSGYDKIWAIEKGSHMTTLKFIFTPDFLKENFYVDDPDLQNTIISKIIKKEAPCYHRQIFTVELGFIMELEEIFRQKQPYLLQTIWIKSKVLQLFCKFFELQVHSTGYYAQGMNVFHEAIALMRESVEENFPGLAVLAAACHVSVPTFKRRFKNFFLSTPEAYYRQLQMEQAEIMLKTPGMTVREVASNFGYVNINSFAKTFKKIKGYFPSRLKTSHLNPV